MTNLAQVRSGASLVLDPFAGTGSVLLPSLALGAPFALGMDIADPHLEPAALVDEKPPPAVIDRHEQAAAVVDEKPPAVIKRHDHARANARRGDCPLDPTVKPFKPLTQHVSPRGPMAHRAEHAYIHHS